MASLRRWKSGQILLFTTIALVTLIGFVALATDIGLLWADRRRMQTAADAAAVAGVTALRNNESTTAAADGVAALNGFTSGSNGVTVAVNNPPLSGPYSGNSNYVEIVLAQPEPTFFLRVLGYDSIGVQVRAVAGDINGPACVYALDPSASGALTLTGTSTIKSACGVIDNSNSSSALTASGTAGLNATSIGIVGNYSISGNATLTPAPKTQIAPVTDPLSYLQPPSVGSCTYKGTVSISGSGSSTLYPGVYCGGIKISGSGTVKFSPGTYILDGGGLKVSGSSTLSGNGVTFYNTQGYSSYQPIAISGSTTLTLSAPTSGPLAGILFFQDRSISNGQGSTISGSSTSTFDGVIYFPTTQVTYTGSSSNSGYTIVVADTIKLSGSSGMYIGNNYSSLSGGSPIKSSTLYE